MKLFYKGKDGGPDSTVHGYWLVEHKNLFSIALLRFENGSRDVFHSHAFNCVSWLLSGHLEEEHLSGHVEHHYPGIWPIVTKRTTFHKVTSLGRSWVFTIRGPWLKNWHEFLPMTGEQILLKWGRGRADA